MEIELFRLKLIEPEQGSLFKEELDRAAYLGALLNEAQNRELRKGSQWLVGDIVTVDDDQFYLRVGRIGKKKLDQYQNGHFTEDDFATAPWTHVLIDTRTEVLGIVPKNPLSPHADAIARSFAKLLELSPANDEGHIVIKVGPMKDPTDFLTELQAAYEVLSFSFTFTAPNPFDTSKLIEPLEAAIQELGGDSGTVDLKGNMDKDGLVDITQSASATGDTVKAKVRPEQGAKPQLITLKQPTATVETEDLNTQADRRLALDKMNLRRQQIRGEANAED